jgi:hypothetical protein
LDNIPFFAWFQASAAMLMRSAPFCDTTQRWVVVLYRRFGTTYRSHLQGSRSSCRKGSTDSHETSVQNYHSAPRNIAKELIATHCSRVTHLAASWHLTEHKHDRGVRKSCQSRSVRDAWFVSVIWTLKLVKKVKGSDDVKNQHHHHCYIEKTASRLAVCSESIIVFTITWICTDDAGLQQYTPSHWNEWTNFVQQNNIIRTVKSQITMSTVLLAGLKHYWFENTVVFWVYTPFSIHYFVPTFRRKVHTGWLKIYDR